MSLITTLKSLPWRDLIGEARALVVAQFFQVGVAGEVDHRGRSTHDDQGVITWGVKVILNHLLLDESLAVHPPFFWGAVEGVPQLEAVGVCRLDLFQFVPQKDVVLGLHRKENIE